MRLEALLWSVLAISAPALAQVIWRRSDPKFPAWAEPLVDSAGWVHGLVLPYLALIVGSIPGGLVGLYAIEPLQWFAGGLACLSGLAAVLTTQRMIKPLGDIPQVSALQRWRDEPRWALYRATGALWLQDLTLGAALGLLFSVLEWILTALTQHDRDRTSIDRDPLYRSAVSTILFILTRNFWLTAGTQLAFFVLLEIWSRQKHNQEQNHQNGT